MNRPAIDDLLGSILSTWYESVAEWTPPGQLSADTCTECRATALADTVDLSEWPHDLMHQLATSLEAAIVIIADSLETETDPKVVGKRDAHLDECEQPLELCVRDYVARETARWSADLLDVLTECVTPRLDHWISSQTMSLTPHLRG